MNAVLSVADASCVKLSVPAMATRFELVLHGDDAVRLRAAGEEALREIERLESQLSFYRSSSEIHWINARAAREPVAVEPRLFQLLQHCAACADLTDGAFDVTIAPLMRAWRFIGGESAPARTTRELRQAHSLVSMRRHVLLDENNSSVRFDQPGVEIDLGGYGKGYAVERAVEILRDHGISSALLHGGASSVCAIGAPPQETGWHIGFPEAFQSHHGPVSVNLMDRALSVSAIHGRSFVENGRQYGHVMDPRSGEPVQGALAAAVTGPSATVCEVLSTALLVQGQSWLPVLTERFPGYTGFVAW